MEAKTLRNSSEEQELLRAAARWALEYAEKALPVFEERHPKDQRPRQAIEACRDFAHGKARDKNLRMAALSALKAGKGVDQPSKHVAQVATLTAAIAYTHTDLQTGVQGVRQARHVLGPIVYAALALEAAANNDETIGNDLIKHATKSAPHEVRQILEHMPPQPKKNDRVNVLFLDLDTALRSS